MDTFCEWPNPVLSAAFALPAEPPEGHQEKKWLSRLLSSVNARYVPSKAKEAFAEMRGLPHHLRVFLPVLLRHTYDGVSQQPVSLRQLAADLDRTPRTVQNYIWEAEELFPDGIKVTRKKGIPHTFRFAVQLLVQIEAIVSGKPQGEGKPIAAPPPTPKEVNKATQKQAYIYACWYELLQNGKTREEADAEIRLRFPELTQKKKPAGGVVSMVERAVEALASKKAISPTRAG